MGRACADWKRLDPHRASDRKSNNLQEQKANTANAGKLHGVPVMASGWRKRNQKSHLKIVRQVALATRYTCKPQLSLTMNPFEDSLSPRENLWLKTELPCGLTAEEPGGRPALETAAGQWERSRT